jgi:hypothetical protein
MAVQQCDDLVIEAVSQSLSPGYDVPSPLDSIRVNRPWLRWHDKFLQPPEVEEALFRLLYHSAGVEAPFQVLNDVQAKELEAF